MKRLNSIKDNLNISEYEKFMVAQLYSKVDLSWINIGKIYVKDFNDNITEIHYPDNVTVDYYGYTYYDNFQLKSITHNFILSGKEVTQIMNISFIE